MHRLLGWLLKRLRPREGWAIFFVVMVALACPAAALAQVTKGIGAERLLLLTFMAALTGLALAHSRMRAGRSALVGALSGAALIVVVLAGLLPPPWLLWREIYDKIPNSLVPCRLTEGKEAVGNLLDVLEMEGFAVAVFSWGLISVPIEFAVDLQELRGKKIAILHLEGWHIRVLDAERIGYRPVAEEVV